MRKQDIQIDWTATWAKFVELFGIGEIRPRWFTAEDMMEEVMLKIRTCNVAPHYVVYK